MGALKGFRVVRQLRTHAVQQTTPSFDELVGAEEKRL
jgi:hypothetical protein